MVFLANRQYSGLPQVKQGVASKINIPAPTGGLNTKDAESQMPATDAVFMENWWPGQGSLSTRKGYTPYVTGLTGDVETLMEYNAVATRLHMCANNGEINDITNPASIVNLGSGFTNNRWQEVNFNANMLLVNGADTPQVFDGSTLTSSTISGSGLTPSDLDGVNIHKNRVFVWNSNAQDFWYGATNAIGGTFTKFPLSRVARSGGNLISMQTWNLDGGDGVDDYALFLMSSGDVLLYAGTDPGSDWSLVGTFTIGAPIAIRGAKKVGSDVVIITDQDFVLFSEVFKSGGFTTGQSKLSGAALEAADLYRANYGWEVVTYPAAGWLMFNVPVATGVTYIQYVVNTITGAATKFTNMNAFTWGLYNENLFFGSSGTVFQADSGLNDNGDYIVCDVRQAFNNLGSNLPKTINSYRNTIKTDGTTVINSGISFDYGVSNISQSISSDSVGSFWDVALWDVALWSPESQTRSRLVLSSGTGVDVSMRLKTSLKGQQVFWYRTDYSYILNNTV
jgi:hypothetical protein